MEGLAYSKLRSICTQAQARHGLVSWKVFFTIQANALLWSGPSSCSTVCCGGSRCDVFDRQLRWYNLSDALLDSLSHILKAVRYGVWEHVMEWFEENTPNNGVVA
jgi:hypothetical protein